MTSSNNTITISSIVAAVEARTVAVAAVEIHIITTRRRSISRTNNVVTRATLAGIGTATAAAGAIDVVSLAAAVQEKYEVASEWEVAACCSCSLEKRTRGRFFPVACCSLRTLCLCCVIRHFRVEHITLQLF